jgi:hypothetical protein
VKREWVAAAYRFVHYELSTLIYRSVRISVSIEQRVNFMCEGSTVSVAEM